MRRLLLVIAVLLVSMPVASAQALAPDKPEGAVRFATFNAYLNRERPGLLWEELSRPGAAQPAAIAEIIQRVRPDILVLQEFDRDPNGEALRLFRERYLKVGQNGAEPIEYPHILFPPSNTGEPSGRDLNRNGIAPDPGDAFGFGAHPGQYAFAILSRHPIDLDAVRSFRFFLWKDMPGARLPDHPDRPGRGDLLDADDLAIFRLSSKNHVDAPIRVGNRVVHVLASHPTPPIRDMNARRNSDEIRLWADYLTPERAAYLADDAGARGGLGEGESAVVMGDLNADPTDGGGLPGSIRQLLDHPRLNGALQPVSEGGAALPQDGANAMHKGNPAADTADFDDARPGNLRVDYVIPTRDLEVVGSGVVWPAPDDPFARLFGGVEAGGQISSDHRMVWVDVVLPD